MIFAGLALLAVGVADVVRQSLRGVVRLVALGVAAVLLILLGVFADAVLPAVFACLIAAGWVWAMPLGRRPRAGAWPILAFAVVCIVAVVLGAGERGGGLLGEAWRIPAPWGTLSFAGTVLFVGTLVFLSESANVIVRVALMSKQADPAVPTEIQGSTERTEPAKPPMPPIPPVPPVPPVPPLPADAATRAGAWSATPAPAPALPVRPTHGSNDVVAPLDVVPDLKGGRLIGPLERFLVFALSLAGAYALVAAFVAAKGIVRFPEISRDRGTGNRAEYFLVGSMVSWVIALGAALLVWWSGAA